ARILSKRGDSAQAAKLLEDVEARYRKTRPPECVCYASLDYERAKLALARGDAQDALAHMNKAVALAEQKTSPPDALRYFVFRRAEVELAANELQGARIDAQRAIDLGLPVVGPGMHSSYLGLAYLVLGRALLASGPNAEASRALSSAVEQLRPT